MAGSSAHPSSAAAFVEGGLQEAAEDCCSICLEDFCHTDPTTVTTCNHEYHLQCILEWFQKSKECPMCWQPLSLKDPSSQELLDSIEQERNFQQSQQFPGFFYGDLRFQHGQATSNNSNSSSDLEERIMQHFAVMGRHPRRLPRRSNHLHRDRPSHGHGQTQPQFILVSDSLPPSSAAQDDPTPPFITSLSLPEGNQSTTVGQARSERERLELVPDNHEQGVGGASVRPSFSDFWKSCLSGASSRYKESVSKTTKGLWGKLHPRNNSVSDFSARVRETSADIVQALEQISLESPSRGNEVVEHNEGTSATTTEPVTSYATSQRVLATHPSSDEAPHYGFDRVTSKEVEGSSDYGSDIHRVTAVPFHI